MLFAELPAQPAVDGVSQTFQKWSDVLQDSFNRAFHNVIDFAPRVVAMIVVMVVGYIAASLIGRIITLLCEKVGLQRAAEHSGLAQSMQHMGIKRNVSAVIGTIVFWLLMCVFLMAAFNILGLTELSRAMETVVNYIPKLLGRDGRRGRGAVDRQLPPRRDCHQCRSRRHHLCRSAGCRLLLCAGGAHVLHGPRPARDGA